MRKSIILSGLILFLSIQLLYSQDVYLDSLKQKLESDSIKIFKPKKYLPVFIFDSRNSIISSAPINIIGLQVGVRFNEKDILGMGGYRIYLPFKIKDDSGLYQLRIAYLTMFYRFLVVNKRYYEVRLMGEIGAGQFNVHRIVDNTEKFVRRGGFYPFGLSGELVFKPIKWLGIQGMLGYRWMLQKEFYNTFSAPFYSIGIWFALKDFIRFVRYNCIAKPRYKKQVKKHLSI